MHAFLIALTAISVFLAMPVSNAAMAKMRKGGGGADTGGGYAIRCDNDEKLYAWDYINRKVKNMPVDPIFSRATRAQEILEILKTRLEKVNAFLAWSLADFMRFNENLVDNTTNRVWLAGSPDDEEEPTHSRPLIPLGDEDRSQIPNCLANAGPDFSLIQAIIRTAPGKKFYQYDAKLIAQLEANSAVQLSFLYVHEWLRDYSDNANSIVLANQLLHSANWPDDMNDTLSGLGLRFPQASVSTDFAEGSYAYQKPRSSKNSQKPIASRLEIKHDLNGVYVSASLNSLMFYDSFLGRPDRTLPRELSKTAINNTTIKGSPATEVDLGLSASKSEFIFAKTPDFDRTQCLKVSLIVGISDYQFQNYENVYCPVRLAN